MISREEARAILKEMYDSMHDGYITHLAYGGKQDETMESDIEALSVAITFLSQPERPKGRWEWKHRMKGGFHTYTGVDSMGETHTITVDERHETEEPYCPICGRWNDSQWLDFCPNCGADCRESE